MRASRDVHRNPAPARDEAGDRLARQRVAALRESHQHVADARDDDRAAGGFARFLGGAFSLRGTERRRRFLRTIDFQFVGGEKFSEQLRRRDYSVANRCEQAVNVAPRKFREHSVQPLVRFELRDAELDRFELVIDQRYAEVARAFRLLIAEPLADARFRARGGRVVRPILARHLLFRCEHLDRVARSQPIAQRHHAPVDSRARQMVSDLRMDSIREIDHGRAERKIEHVALGREHENFLGEKIVLDRREKFLRVLEILLPFDQPPQPREPLGIFFLEVARVAVLVAPVRRDSFLRHLVHLARANLHFHPLPARPDHRGMQRLVHVGLGQRDVILEAPRHRLPVRMHDAERFVTFADRVNDDAKRDQIVNFFEAEPQLLHLRVNRKEMLGPAGDLGGHSAVGHAARQNLDDVGDIFFALFALRRDESLQRLIRAGIQITKRQVLELRFEPINTESMCDRRVNFHRLARDLLLAFGGEMVERAHVMQAVGELDQHDANVVRHRDDHLAEILGLLFLAALKRDLRDLRHAVHELRDLWTKVCLHLGQRRMRIFDDVVQKAGDDRRHVELELRDNHRDVERMSDVRLARFALLIDMHPRRVIVGAPDKADVGLRIVGLHPPDQAGELVGSAALR